MIIKADAAALEWRVKVFLSQDPVAIEEIQNDFPIHDDNQRIFGLPTRTIAKIFLYRIIFADSFGDRGFGGPAFAYANDSDFMGTSQSPKFWERVIERFFDKYKGVYNHSVRLIRQAIETGTIESPSGRLYHYSPQRGFGGSSRWPHTEILNHIVQGLSADLVMEARLILAHRLQKRNYGDRVLLMNTVHDSIDLDVDNDPELCYNISILLQECFRDIPLAFKKHFGVDVNVPMAGEVKMGWTAFEDDMLKFKPDTFNNDWSKLYNELSN